MNSGAEIGLLPDTFGIATLQGESEPFPAIVLPDGRIIDVSHHYIDTHAVFNNWSESFGILADIATTAADSGRFSELTALPPVAHPNLLCAGANYKTHSAQMLTKNKFNQHNRRDGETDKQFFARNYALMEERGRNGTPFFWTGLHSSLVGANHEIVLPLIGHQPDWELELGVIFGGTARYADPEEAMELVAGYVMVNDLGTVDIFKRDDIPWGYDWVSKHQPTFKPMGPFIVPSQFVSVDEHLKITLSVNGRAMQDWPADDMIFDIPHFITYASERVNILPGDLMIFGSPPGNGAHHGRFLQPGDVITSSITGLGEQRNLCVAEDAHGRLPYYPTFGSAPSSQ